MPSIRNILLTAASLSLACCDRPWMETKVHLKDEAEVTVQHRADGTFRTIVSNQYGRVAVDNELGGDSRHVCLYRSPAGLIIVIDNGAIEMVADTSSGHSPAVASPQAYAADYKKLSKWQFISSVRRTSGNMMSFFGRDDYCYRVLGQLDH